MIFLLGGLLVLIVGANLSVTGASRLSGLLGLSPLVIGLTVVAFGTSAPELAVSLYSVSNGQGGVAMGNVIGSNIFNVLFILGLLAMITPLRVAQRLIRMDVPLMIASSLLIMLFSLDNRLGLLEGAILFNALVLYILYVIHQSYQESRQIKAEYAAEYDVNAQKQGHNNRALDILLATVKTVFGLLFLVAGARWVVSGAVQLATQLGVSELAIGLTIIAIGTSLPEAVTSIVAALKGENDIAVGNVIGSNLFNLLGVLGLTGLLIPDGMPVSDVLIGFDIPLMTVVAFACLPVFFSGHMIARWEGGVFVFYYFAYLTYSILSAIYSPTLEIYRWALLIFILPLILLTLAIGVVRRWHHRHHA